MFPIELQYKIFQYCDTKTRLKLRLVTHFFKSQLKFVISHQYGKHWNENYKNRTFKTLLEALIWGTDSYDCDSNVLVLYGYEFSDSREYFTSVKKQCFCKEDLRLGDTKSECNSYSCEYCWPDKEDSNDEESED